MESLPSLTTMQPLNRYNVTFHGEIPTRLAKEPTGSKVDVKPGETVNVHAVVAAQLRGAKDWTVEAAEMGEQSAEETERKAKAKAENDKREAELKEQIRKDEEERAAKEAKEAEKRKKDQEKEDTEEDEEEDDEKNERKGKTVTKKKSKK